MIILGIESSCDETAAALLQDGRRILSSVVSSQIEIHREYGGVVPELASREHVENLAPVVSSCLRQAGCSLGDVDAVAATRGPGLMGALLAGMAYAKGLAYALQLPFLGVNHLEGHIASVFLDHPEAELPALSLVVSGGHTNLYLLDGQGKCRLLARTLDDAAGEALDKLAKLLGLGYPGGPAIDRLSASGDPDAVPFSLPKINDGSESFSFSGLKTAALRHVRQKGFQPFMPEDVEDPANLPGEALDLIASYQKAVVDQLLDRIFKFLPGREIRSVHFSGGVSCNSELRRTGRERLADLGLPAYFPRPELTTDNAVMIAAAADRRVRAGESDPWTLKADPNLRAGEAPIVSPSRSSTFPQGDSAAS